MDVLTELGAEKELIVGASATAMHGAPARQADSAKQPPTCHSCIHDRQSGFFSGSLAGKNDLALLLKLLNLQRLVNIRLESALTQLLETTGFLLFLCS